MRSPAVRIALTILLPLLVVFASDHVLLPGMEEMLRTTSNRASFLTPSRAGLSIFALGVMPVLTAYSIVEVASFLVPKWSRLRHGNPEGRAKLERAARVLAILLGAFQAFGISVQLAALDQATGLFATGVQMPSAPIVIATLVGGLCCQIVVAEIVSRQRIANGYVLIVVFQLVAELRGSFAASIQKSLMLGTLQAKHVVLMLLAVALPAAATWISLRATGRGIEPERAGGDRAGPYRAARALAVSPWVPVPASSLIPYTMAVSLIGLPSTLLLVIGSRKSADDYSRLVLDDSITFTIVFSLSTVALALAFARLLHRPQEMADVASRLGFKGGEKATSKAAAALAATRVPTLLFFATLLIATMAAGALPGRISILAVPLMVAIVMDVGASLRAVKRVAVWQERRASAVPVIRAVLAAEGIDATVRGMSVLSLLQAFAPYAPAEIMVDEEDAPRAVAVLRDVFLGEARKDAERREPIEVKDRAAAWSPSRRNLALALTAVGALGVLGLAKMRVSRHEGTKEPAARLEVVRVDDDSELFENLSDGDVPPGIEIRYENAPVGIGRQRKVYFAQTSVREGEAYEAAATRMRAWCARLAVPQGTRIGLEPVDDYDFDTNKLERTGVRTFLLTGPAILRNEDVVDALPAVNDTSASTEVYVQITLSPAAAERFEQATRENVQRRIAIVVGDEINSAPVVKSAIGGGRLSITMGAGDVDVQLANAKKLARALAPEGSR